MVPMQPEISDKKPDIHPRCKLQKINEKIEVDQKQSAERVFAEKEWENRRNRNTNSNLFGQKDCLFG